MNTYSKIERVFRVKKELIIFLFLSKIVKNKDKEQSLWGGSVCLGNWSGWLTKLLSKEALIAKFIHRASCGAYGLIQSLSSRVRLLKDFFQFFERMMGVQLRGCQALVSQQVFDCTQICPLV